MMVNASNRVFAPGTGRSAGMIFGIAIIAAFYINAGAARASLRGRRDTSAHHIAGVSVPRKLAVLGRHSLGRSEGYAYA